MGHGQCGAVSLGDALAASSGNSSRPNLEPAFEDAVARDYRTRCAAGVEELIRGAASSAPSATPLARAAKGVRSGLMGR
jgi:hypothetical protein